MATNPLVIRSIDCGASGVFADVSASRANWQYLNMEARRLERGGRHSESTGTFELAMVILGGRCHVRTNRGEFLDIGRRPHVFAGMPWALYLPPYTTYEIEALSNTLEVAICWVEAEDQFPPKLVTPADCAVELRGGDNASRQINSILPPGFPCQRIVAVEVYTPGGNWSSYPPHKHDVHREDADGHVIEADLEEIYFYKFERPEGYAYQRVYTGDNRLDELVRAQHHDIVLVPEGYHPVVAAPGYNCYYLNFLAGSAQSLAYADDPAYAWVKSTWGPLDPRLPLVGPDAEK